MAPADPTEPAATYRSQTNHSQYRIIPWTEISAQCRRLWRKKWRKQTQNA